MLLPIVITFAAVMSLIVVAGAIYDVLREPGDIIDTMANAFFSMCVCVTAVSAIVFVWAPHV